MDLPLPLVKEARLETQLVAQVRDGDLVHHVAAKDLSLLLGGVVATGTLARHEGLLPTCLARRGSVSCSDWCTTSPLRTCPPAVAHATLRKLKDYFPSPDFEYPLEAAHEPDQTYYPAGTIVDPAKQAVFADLQKFRAARLVSPVGEEHMFWAAIRGKSCRLTPLGQFYWKRAKDNLL